MFDTSLRNSFLLRADHGSAWSQAFTSLVGTNCGATAGCRLLLKTVGGFVRCDCGSDVILNVEAVLSVGLVDRSVLTADVCAGLGLTTCERDGVGQIARLSPRRTCA